MQFIYTTANGTSPAEDEKQQLIDQIELYEDLIRELIQHADIVQHDPRGNAFRIFVSKHNAFYIEIRHCYECMNLWKIAKAESNIREIAESDTRLNNNEENEND